MKNRWIAGLPMDCRQERYCLRTWKADGVSALNDKYAYMNEKPMDCQQEIYCLHAWKADGVPVLNDKYGYINEKPMDCRFADGLPVRKILFTYMKGRWSPGIE